MTNNLIDVLKRVELNLCKAVCFAKELAADIEIEKLDKKEEQRNNES